MAVRLLMEESTKCINAKDFYILISKVIHVNLVIHSVKPKVMERLLKFLPTTFIKVLNGVWGRQNNRGLFPAMVKNSNEAV